MGRDLAESLGTAAVMAALVRTAIGDLRIEESHDPHTLNRDNWLELLQPPLRAVDDLPRAQLSSDQATRIRNGQEIELRIEGIPVAASPAELVAIDPAGQLVGLLAPAGPGRWRTLRNLPTNVDD